MTFPGAVEAAGFFVQWLTALYGLASTAQPDERFPQWTQRRKMAPGSHHMP
jgi:hypothetical protein